MKKLLSLILSVSVIAGIAINIFTAAAESNLNSSTAEEFAREVYGLMNAYEDSCNLPGKDNNFYQQEKYDNLETCRLIVKSPSNIDTLGAVSVINGYDNLWVLQFENPEETAQAFEYYSTRAGIEFVEADKQVILSIPVTLDDSPMASDETEHLSWGPAHIGFDIFNSSIKEYGIETTETVIAVVDTGVDSNHPFLTDKVIPTKINTSSSGIRNDSTDDHGHGTQVAGVIADCAADNVYIKPYKVFNNRGQGTTISVAAGINCAVKDKVDVINVSIGFDENSEVLKAAVENAEQNDITVVSASGNDGSDSLYYPASYGSVLKISAVNDSNVIANFSTIGDDVDFAAPGVNIKTTTLNNGYSVVKGTSFASPFAAAAVAAILTVQPNASTEDIRDILATIAVKISEYEADKKYGSGIIHLPEISSHTIPTGKTETPYFSMNDAFYSHEISLEMFCDTPGSVIYYTTDRTVPSKTNPSAKIYDGSPLHLSQTTVIMAVAYCNELYRSAITSFNAIIAPIASESEFTVDSSGKLISYSGTATSITVPNLIDGTAITSVGENAFANSNITEIILPKSVNEICSGAFSNCADLKTVSASNATIIGDRAFYNCHNLRNPYLGNLTSIGEYSFYSVCSRHYTLNERTFTLNLKNLTDIPDGAFMNSAVSSIELGNLTSLGKNAFSECHALVSIEIDSLADIPDGAFKGCSSLADVDIYNLSHISAGAFSTCESLRRATIPDAAFVDSNAFENCVSLVEVNLDKAETVYSNAFSGCTDLRYLSLPSLKKFEMNQGDRLIKMPKNLETFIAPKITSTVTDMFNTANKIQNIYLNSVTSVAEYTFRGCHNIFLLNLESVERLNQNALAYCTIQFIDARRLISTDSMPDNSGILLSNNFVESTDNAENLTVYGTPGTFIERYAKYKGYAFVPIPLIVNQIPEYVTVNSETIYILAVGFDLTYQWYWNTVNSTEGGTPIDGATTSSYTFTDKDTAPYYYCVMTQTDMEKISVIKTNVITKDTKPADYSEYNEAVNQANSINRSLYENLYLLDNALKVDVSGRYSCEQEIVDTQTKAIKEAIRSLKYKTAKSIALYSSATDLRVFESTKIIAVINPVDAIYSGINWSSSNPDAVIVSKTGNIRCIGDGSAIIKAQITNADGTITEGSITIECDLTVFEKIIATIFKYIFIIAVKTDI